MVAAGVAQGVGAGETPAGGIIIPVAETHKPGVVVNQAAREADGYGQGWLGVFDYVAKTVVLDVGQRCGSFKVHPAFLVDGVLLSSFLSLRIHNSQSGKLL